MNADGSVPIDALESDDQESELDQVVVEGLRSLGGTEFLDELVSLFRRDVGRYLTEVEEALETRDLTAFREATHSIIGCSASMGAIRLAAAVAALEQATASGDLGEARALLDDVVQCGGRAFDALSREAASGPD